MLASSAGSPGFNPQSRTASYQRRYKNGTSSSLVWNSALKKGNTGSFSRIKMGLKKVLDKIWYENPSKSEVIGPCGGDGKKQMITQNRQTSNAKKTRKNYCNMLLPQMFH